MLSSLLRAFAPDLGMTEVDFFRNMSRKKDEYRSLIICYFHWNGDRFEFKYATAIETTILGE